MKKIKVIAITGAVLATMGFLAGCGETSDSQTGKSEPVKQEQTASTAKEDNAKESQSIDKVIYDKDGIKITAKGIEKTVLGTKLKLAVENNTDKACTIQARDVSLNGIMVDGIFSADIAAGKKANDGIEFLGSTLKENDITDIKDVELKFHIFDSADLLSGFDTDIIKIEY